MYDAGVFKTWQISNSLITVLYRQMRFVVIALYAGLVPEQASQVAQDWEDVGQVDDHGRVRAVRGDGPTLAAVAGHHRQVC